MTSNYLYFIAGVFVLAALQVNGVKEFTRDFNTVKNPIAEASQKPAKPSRDVNCYDENNVPHIERIPDPYNCSLFYKCDRIFPDQPMHPYPIRQECPPGLGLCYDYITCNCEYCDMANCFDADNPEHNEERFRCACPLTQTREGDVSVNDSCAGSYLSSTASPQ